MNTSFFNTFVSANAGAVNTSGNTNVFVGTDAGSDNTTGNNRVLRFAAPAAPTAAAVTISGRAITSTGRGITNVMIQLTDAGGVTRTALTSAFGYYRFADVQAGETVIISAYGKSYSFSQPTQVVNAFEDTAEINFVAYPTEERIR